MFSLTLHIAGIKEQTLRVLENLKSIVEESGQTLNDVVKTTVFIKDLNFFSNMNEVYGQYFHKDVLVESN